MLRAVADPAHPEGGHAVLDVPLAAAPPPDARFRLTREGWARGTLGPEGWQVAEAFLVPLRVEPIRGGARLFLGPAIVDQLEAGPLWFRWPAAGVEAPLFWPDIAPRHAGAPPAPAPAPPPEPAATPCAPVPATPLVPPPPAAPSRAPWLLLPLALLAAGGAAWWLTRADAPPLVAAPAPSAAPAVPPAPAPAPETPAVAEVIAHAPSLATISEEAARRQAQGRHDDALLLWEHAARHGHAPAMTALARLYDPNGFVPGRPFRDPDPRQAARFYRDAEAAGDDAAAAPRRALREFLETRAAAGDVLAPLTLRDFWP